MVSQQERLTVQVGPISTNVVKSGQGEPLLYLHGAFGYEGWPTFLERLSERFTVYAPIHPGFGETDGIDQIEDILDLTLYHYDLLDALELERPKVIGHYFGAMIAAEMTALCPHRIGKLLLASPTGLWSDDAPGIDIFATPATELPKVVFSNSESEAAKRTFPQAKDDEEVAIQQIVRVRALSTVGKFLWPLPDKGLRKRLHRIQSATLIVTGENDRVVPLANTQEMASLIPHAQLEIVKGAGHMVMFEEPDEFLRITSNFLS